MRSLELWAKHARLLSYELLYLIVDGPMAVGIVHVRAQCLANNNEYDVYVAVRLTIETSRIKHYQVYWDASPLIRAFRENL
jgi:hypothetical protein